MELFVAVGVGLLTSEALIDGAGEPGLDVGVDVGVELGLELGVPVGDAEFEFVGVGLPEGLLLGVAVGEEQDESVGLAEAEPDEGEGDDGCDGD